MFLKATLGLGLGLGLGLVTSIVNISIQINPSGNGKGAECSLSNNSSRVNDTLSGRARNGRAVTATAQVETAIQQKRRGNINIRCIRSV